MWIFTRTLRIEWIFLRYDIPRWLQRMEMYGDDPWQLKFHVPYWFIVLHSIIYGTKRRS